MVPAQPKFIETIEVLLDIFRQCPLKHIRELLGEDQEKIRVRL